MLVVLSLGIDYIFGPSRTTLLVGYLQTMPLVSPLARNHPEETVMLKFSRLERKEKISSHPQNRPSPLSLIIEHSLTPFVTSL